MGQRELRLAGVRFILGFDFVYEIVKGISRKIANMKRTLNSGVVVEEETVPLRARLSW